jgi:RNA polymerase sigma-70 factor (ECF subfamily)
LDVIRECQQGNLKAFEELVRSYWPVAMRVTMAFVRNVEEAADCSQDAFVLALETLPKFDNTKPFFPWFYALLRNVCLKRLRRTRRRNEIPLEAAGDPVAERNESKVELSVVIRRALDELSTEQREILILRHWEDLSYEEIAAITNLPLGTVMSRLHHARRQMRAILREPMGGC